MLELYHHVLLIINDLIVVVRGLACMTTTVASTICAISSADADRVMTGPSSSMPQSRGARMPPSMILLSPYATVQLLSVPTIIFDKPDGLDQRRRPVERLVMDRHYCMYVVDHVSLRYSHHRNVSLCRRSQFDAIKTE